MAVTMNQAPELPLPNDATDTSWGEEIRATFRLAWPLVIAQLAQIALFTTDVIMMGWLGPKFLAAGTLTVSFFHPFLMFGIGLVSAVTPLVAQARGSGDVTSLRRSVRQGFWVAIAIALVMMPIIWNIEPLFSLLGQSAQVSALAATYARPIVGVFLPAFAVIALRGMLAPHGDTKIILLITLAAIAVNAAGNYALMFGHWGLPRLELKGAAISTLLVNIMTFALMLTYTLSRPIYRSYELFVRFWRPDWPRFFRILQLGVPIGLILMAEVGLFAVAGQMMGWLGTNELAAHAIALQIAAIAFMVPMGLSHAATVRVGLAAGRRSAEGVRKAGWVSIGLGTGFMASTAIAFYLVPEQLIALFLDPALPQNRIPFALAVSYLGVAAMFQLVDGAQVVSAAVLRGLSDTAVPMIAGIVGYWGIGAVLAYLLGFVFGFRGVGIWLGLAAGLAVVALALTARFAFRRTTDLL